MSRRRNVHRMQLSMWKPKHRLDSWLRTHEFSASPPMALIAAAFPEYDEDQWRYYYMKPHRIYGRLFDAPYYLGKRYYL